MEFIGLFEIEDYFSTAIKKHLFHLRAESTSSSEDTHTQARHWTLKSRHVESKEWKTKDHSYPQKVADRTMITHSKNFICPHQD
jgi:hypothetical protein